MSTAVLVDSAQNIPVENTIPVGNNLPVTPAPAAMMDMPLAWIWPSTFNPRRTFDDTALRELADSILAHGMLEPIVVRAVLTFPCAHDTIPVSKGEHDLWNILIGRRKASSGTPPGSSMAKDPSITPLETIASAVALPKARSTTVKTSHAGSGNSGELAPSIASESRDSALLNRPTLAGSGPSTQPAKSNMSWKLACRTCESNASKLKGQSPSQESVLQPAAALPGPQAKTVIFASNGEMPMGSSPLPSAGRNEASAIVASSWAYPPSPVLDLTGNGVKTRTTTSDHICTIPMPQSVSPSDAPMVWCVDASDDSTFARFSGSYSIIAGERRYRAARLAKLDTVPVRILTGIDDTKALQLAILENLQRVDLDPVDEARGFAALRDQAGMTQAEIGAAVKRSQPVIAKSLALLKLPDDVLQAIQEGKLSASHGQVLAKFGDFPAVASSVAKWAINDSVTTRQLEQNPLGNTYEATQKGIIRRLDFDTAFDRAVCATCPFGAYVQQGQYTQYCLKPEHFDELQAAAVKERQRETNRAVQAAKRDGGSVLKLANMGHMNYTTREGTSVPASCTDACPCAAQALDGMGNLRPVCTDRKRYEALKATQLKDEKKAKRETVKAQIEDLANHLQQLDGIGSAQLAALILPQLRHVSKAAWEGAVAKHKAGHLTNKDAVTAAALAQLEPVDLIRFSLQAIIGHELLASIEESWRPMDAWKYYRTVILPAVGA